MSALPEAIPLALAAAVNAPAIVALILLLSGKHPQRLVLGFLAGAATAVVGIGLVGLLVLSASGATGGEGRSASGGVDLVLGLALVGLSAWAWRRRAHPPREPEGPEDAGRLARLSDRAATSVRWAFALGLLMYLFSPAYFGAVKAVAYSDSSTTGQLLAVLICAACTLLLVEIPAAWLLVRPDGVKATLERVRDWFATHSWTVVAVVAAAAGAWLLLNGLADVG